MKERYMVIFRPDERKPLEWKQWNNDVLERLDVSWESFRECRRAHPGTTIRVIVVLESIPPWH